MAQLAEERQDAGARVRLLLRQRPWVAIAATLVLGLLVGATVCGVLTAQGAGASDAGFVIERDDERGEGAERDDSGEADEADSEDTQTPIVVDVSGAVASPAVVELDEGARVQDAIEAAGGLTADADISALNRAAACTDGQKIYVPRQGETAPSLDAGAGAAPAPTAAPSLVNINTADEATLDSLPGVGPSTAQAIIEDREANGAFASIDDLMRVSGIGEKKFEKLKSAICV